MPLHDASNAFAVVARPESSVHHRPDAAVTVRRAAVGHRADPPQARTTTRGPDPASLRPALVLGRLPDFLLERRSDLRGLCDRLSRSRGPGETVSAQLGGWFDDYNTRAPHSARDVLGPQLRLGKEPEPLLRVGGLRAGSSRSRGCRCIHYLWVWLSGRVVAPMNVARCPMNLDFDFWLRSTFPV